MSTKMEALYISDFIIYDRRTLNTLCLFYDRLFIHDYFGVYAGLSYKASYDSMQKRNKKEIDILWMLAGGMNKDIKEQFTQLDITIFDAYILKGVAQGLGYKNDKFSPKFVIDFARKYSKFISDNYCFIQHGVLRMCKSLHNPHHPSNIGNLHGMVHLDSNISEEVDIDNLGLARYNNKLACFFEQQYHGLPLISDSDDDKLRWDRERDLLTTVLALASIPSYVPTIADVPAEVILEARERLRDYLPSFRETLLKAAWDIGSAAKNGSKEEILSLAKLYYQTRIQPEIKEIERKVADEQKKMKKSILERGIDQSILVAKSLDPTESYSKWELLGSGLKSLLNIQGYADNKIKIKSPYEFLIMLPKSLNESIGQRNIK